MGIGEAIKKGFGAARKSKGLVLVLFVFGGIFSLINVFLAPAEGADPNTPPPPALVVSGVIFIFLSIYLQAGSMGFVRDLIKSGSAAMKGFSEWKKKAETTLADFPTAKAKSWSSSGWVLASVKSTS